MEQELQFLQDKNEKLEREVSDLLNKIRIVEEENEKLRKENTQLKEKVSEYKKDDKEVIEILEQALIEADKVDVQLSETKDLIEIPPK